MGKNRSLSFYPFTLIAGPLLAGFALLACGGPSLSPAVLYAQEPPAKELTAKYHQDFRVAAPDRANLRPIGEGVRAEPGGVRITLPAGEEVLPAAGLATKFKVHGDFEITTSFEILNADRPAKGYGVGVSIYAALDPNTNDAVSLARRLVPGGETIFISNRMTPAAGKLRSKTSQLPSTQGTGKLRIKRIGPMVHFLVADGDNDEFAQVDEVKFGSGAINFVQIGGNAGNSGSGLDLRLLDFTVRAEALPGVAEPEPAAPPAPPAAAVETNDSNLWLMAALLILVITLSLALGVWLLARQRRNAAVAFTGVRAEANPETRGETR